MLTVSEAFTQILQEVYPLEQTVVPLAESLGLVLAEDVFSDIDSPPFDKSLMDGFAIDCIDVYSGKAQLTVIETVMAGRVPQLAIQNGEATQIMTGAPLPTGANSVVPVEYTQYDPEKKVVHIDTDPVEPGANMMPRGKTCKKGDRVLPAGRQLRPQELGALAEMGKHKVGVHRQPRVSVLATGDELVAVHELPGLGQIRNSNESMLAAQITAAGAEPLPQGIARDERQHLAEKIQQGLQADILLLSGGVSAGQLDLVPSELAAAGVQQVFHKVNLKPGKPLWFGILDRPATDRDEHKPARTYVFGLPGNPVSSMVCFELFVRTVIRRLMGVDPPEPKTVSARLLVEHQSRGDRPTYHPAYLRWEAAGAVVRPIRWQGSSDLQATVETNCMVVFPAGDKAYSAGDEVQAILWD
jgi:molybdopterin molybdotransferase